MTDETPDEMRLLTTVFSLSEATTIEVLLNGYNISHVCRDKSFNSIPNGIRFYVPVSIFEDATALLAKAGVPVASNNRPKTPKALIITIIVFSLIVLFRGLFW